MNYIFTLAETPEAQKNEKIILHTHVLFSLQSASCFLGSISAIAVFAFKRHKPLTQLILKYNTTFNIAATVSSPFLVEFKMKNKEEIEWKDRSWRLLQNEKQLVLDKTIPCGIVGGIALGLLIKNPNLSMANCIIGGAGIGSTAGFLTGMSVLRLK